MDNAVRKDELPAAERLKITEIFHSLQGEAATSGIPTVFIRLTGCPLRCQYCDTSYAFFGGRWMDFDSILTAVDEHSTSHVCVTGGEPLAQKNCAGLLARLCDAGYTVSIETSGAFDIDVVDPRVARVLDIKTPGSGESHRNLLENLSLLTGQDQVKFVICDRADYQWAGEFIGAHKLLSRCQVFYSSSYGQLNAAELAGWILDDGLQVRFQIQLHKFLWGEEPGR